MLYPVRPDPIRTMIEAIHKYLLDSSIHPARRISTLMMTVHVVTEIANHC